jgi:PAS domain S-box-containing protein
MAGTDDKRQQVNSPAPQNANGNLVAQRRTEVDVWKHSQWLTATLASMGDGVICTDALGRVSFLNDVASSLTGWAPSEAIGRPLPEIFQIVDGRALEPIDSPALRALKQRAIVRLANPMILIARDGTRRPIDDCAAPMLSDAQELLGAVLVFRDVTERKQAFEIKARLAAIVESSEDAIVSKTLDGVILTWNAGAEHIFGYTASEAVGQSITIIIPPERYDEERYILAQIRQGQRIESFETIRVAKDGRRLHISLTISPIRDDEGRVIGTSKIARDITERTVAARREREQGRLMRLLPEAALTIHSSGSLDSVLRAIAEEARRILCAQRAVSSLPVDDDSAQGNHNVWAAPNDEHRLAPGLEALVEDLSAEVCRTNRPMRLAWAELAALPAVRQASAVGQCCNGLTSWLAAPFVSRTGKNLGLVQVSNKVDGDFSELDEAALVQLAHLASVAIENARLYGELREQDRRKDEFLALLAHELRNPLAPLRNGLQVMRLADRDPASMMLAREMMERQLNHMVRLVDDLLDVSRISRNKMELRRSRVLLADVVSGAVELARPVVEAAGHELIVTLPEQPIYLDADLTRLAQVFGNLLTNSAKYTERGGRIWLTANREGHQVSVGIRDTGIGIPDCALPHIFDMFSQVDRSIERSTGGLGIGLALVRGLVEMHGGTVEASSPGPGAGSTFIVRLPVLEDHVETPTLKPSDNGARAVGANRRILVVDDNRDSAISMTIMLRLLGNDVRSAHDGLEAFELAQSFHPQVILMDLGMPKLNGYDATRRIREQPWGHDTIIVALTGWGQEVNRARSKEVGCDGHLVKPVHLPDLEDLLNELAEREGKTISRNAEGLTSQGLP